jgi:hypothetical protein
MLASGTVRDLVAGSAVAFAARGTYEIEGAPGRWELYAVVSA